MEEKDLRARSTKKVKRGAQPTGSQEVEMEEVELVPKMNPIRGTAPPVLERNASANLSTFRDKLMQNNPNISFTSHNNAIWKPEEEVWDTEDDETMIHEGEDQGEDPGCPTIRFTKEEKIQLQRPWKNALILKLIEKGIGYLQLKKALLPSGTS